MIQGTSNVQDDLSRCYRFFLVLLRYEKLFPAMALKYAYFMLFQNINWKGQFISCIFKLLQQFFFLTYRFLEQKGIRVSYGNKCGMRYLVKIGSGMCDPDSDVLISIQNIFISKERLRLQATVLWVLDIFGCLFLQIYLC